jgi:hypothetical protein
METTSSPNQPLRGVRPDAETPDKFYLFKNVTTLRATYQIRLLALSAGALGKRLVLMVPPACRFDQALDGLIQALPDVIRREDLA